MAKKILSRKKKRSIIIGVCIGVGLAALITVGLLLTGSSSSGTVYVQSVPSVSGGNSSAAGIGNVYSGVIQSAKTVNVSRNVEYTVSKLNVSAGTKVKKGDVLFEYDMAQNSLDIKRAQLELEKLETTLSSYKEQISQYKKQRDNAESENEELEYTSQILSLQTQLKETQYDIESKQLEISDLKKVASNSSVVSPISGVVKQVSESSADAYITLVSTGKFTVKGEINEQNIEDIKVGVKVVIRSRVDDTKLWRGTVSSIDEDPVSDSTAMNKSSNYNFYISLSDDDNLKLGQHVYIEADYGQRENGSLSIPEYYICDAQTKPYVWAMDSDGKIARRYVELGQYNKQTSSYDVKSGLSASDYIAWPSAQVKEGQKVIINDSGAQTATAASSEK